MKKEDVIKKKAEYCLNCKTKPCTNGCPLGNNIPVFINCVKNGDYEGAYNVLQETTVLAPICGRVCPHFRQCQGSCVRGINGLPVSIGELEAFVGDVAIEKEYSFACDNNKIASTCSDSCDIKDGVKRVAIVGSGPAGLTCAAFLARKGFNVTIFEKHGKLGGLLRYGIPDFRLDRKILDLLIDNSLNLGIRAVCGKKLGNDFSLVELKNDFDAVFLAFGANVSKFMNIPGKDLDGVFGGNELLENKLHPDYKGKKVAVIGGGNVAMDVSRTVKRLGADRVFVVYRRAEEQMPADKKEIQDAKNEGVEFLFQHDVVRINGECNDAVDNDKLVSGEDVNFMSDKVTSIECVRTELVKKEGADRLVPVDVDGSNFVLAMDVVVMAIGAEADKSLVSKLGVQLNNWGYIDVDSNFMTSIPGVFAGGDLVGSQATVAWAARNGRDAAESICNFLQNNT